MRSSNNFTFIGSKFTFIDNDYVPVSSHAKDIQMNGQKIDISGLDKAHVACRLYVNLRQGEFVSPLDITEMIFWFKQMGFKLDSFKRRNLCINLSGDFFDPTEYDKVNNTYARDNILTADQCVKQLKNDLEYAHQLIIALTDKVKDFLKRDDVKIDASDEYFQIYFSAELSFDSLMEIAACFREVGLNSYAKSPKTSKLYPSPACVGIRDSYDKIIEKLQLPELVVPFSLTML